MERKNNNTIICDRRKDLLWSKKKRYPLKRTQNLGLKYGCFLIARLIKRAENNISLDARIWHQVRRKAEDFSGPKRKFERNGT